MKFVGRMFVIGAFLILGAPIAQAKKTVRVFILAGQSNMEGKAKVSLMDYQATAEETKDLYTHLRDGDDWVKRDDVFIKFLERKGPLTVGYGSNACTGIELEFGYAMGEHFDDPVVLIKAAWGGHSLMHNFRPPSAGEPGDGKEFGASYKNMMAEFNDVKENYNSMFSGLRGVDFELAGFVWFQGFNDKFGEAPGNYEDNMKLFISDVRKDLEAPTLPFVICSIGTNGVKSPSGTTKTVMDAQMAMNRVDGVKAFRTDELVDKEAAKRVSKAKEEPEEWKKWGSNQAYHYLGSAIWLGRIGKKAGEDMLKLIAEAGPPAPIVFKERIFRSADGTKTFKGTLVAYNAETGEVSVRMSNRRVARFKAEILSAEDQEYLKEGE